MRRIYLLALALGILLFFGSPLFGFDLQYYNLSSAVFTIDNNTGPARQAEGQLAQANLEYAQTVLTFLDDLEPNTAWNDERHTYIRQSRIAVSAYNLGAPHGHKASFPCDAEPPTGTVKGTISAVPEPATLLLLGTGILGLAGFARFRKKRE